MLGLNIRELIRTSRYSLSSVLAVVLGLSTGVLFKQYVWYEDELDAQTIRYLELPGLIFMRTFRLLLAPLIITSLTTSFFVDKTDDAQNGGEQNNVKNDLQKVTGLTFIFTVAFSMMTAIMGVCIILLLQPGVPSSNDVNDLLLATSTTATITSTTTTATNTNNQTLPLTITEQLKLKQESFRKSHYQTDSIYNILISIFPDNPLTPFFMKSLEQTEFIWPQNLSEINDVNFVPRNKIKTSHSFSPNMLGICVLSLSLGFILSKLPLYKTETIRGLLIEIDLVVKCVLDIMLRIMPFGMFCWMFTESLKMKSLTNMAGQLFYFYMIAICMFLLLWFIIYPIIYIIFTRQNPYRLLKSVLPALVVAGASASSALALPLTMDCMETKMKLSALISKMVLPLTMTINMNGTAMYYPMVCVFVSQAKQVPQNFLSYSILCLFSLVMSMGFPGVPSGGGNIVNHLAFASVLGIDNPQDVVVMVLTFDWVFERFRTITNVMGDCYISKCVEKLSLIDNNNVPIPMQSNSSAKPDMIAITDEDMALNNFEK